MRQLKPHRLELKKWTSYKAFGKASWVSVYMQALQGCFITNRTLAKGGGRLSSGFGDRPTCGMGRRWQGCRWQRLLALTLLLLAHSSAARPHEHRRPRQQQADDDDTPVSLPSSNGRRRLGATQLAADISAAAEATHEKHVMRKRAAGEKVRWFLPLPSRNRCSVQRSRPHRGTSWPLEAHL